MNDRDRDSLLVRHGRVYAQLVRPPSELDAAVRARLRWVATHEEVQRAAEVQRVAEVQRTRRVAGWIAVSLAAACLLWCGRQVVGLHQPDANHVEAPYQGRDGSGPQDAEVMGLLLPQRVQQQTVPQQRPPRAPQTTESPTTRSSEGPNNLERSHSSRHAPVKRPETPRKLQTTVDVDPVYEELLSARRDSRAGRFAAALVRLERHALEIQGTYPHEWDLEYIQVLCSMGEVLPARKRLSEFLRKYPNSVFVEAAKKICRD